MRGKLGDGVPLLLIGSPMGAEGFATLAGYFPDRTVVTYDPRGAGRSARDAPGDRPTITPAISSGSSRRSAAVRSTCSPAPAARSTPSRGWRGTANRCARWWPTSRRWPGCCPTPAALTAAIEDMRQTYQRDGMGPAMAKFITLVMYDGVMPEGYGSRRSIPAQFGLPTEDDGGRDDALLGQNLRTCTGYQPDVDALRASSTHIVIARGAASGQTMAARGADAVAELIGAELVSFPGDHGGFMGGEFGQQGEPEAFAVRLREMLDRA